MSIVFDKEFAQNQEAQVEWIKKVIPQVNTVVGSLIGIPVELLVKACSNSRNKWIEVYDIRKDMQRACGVMKRCFTSVQLKTWNVFFDQVDQSCVMTFNFDYELTGCGSNSVEVCTIRVKEDGFVEIVR